MIIDLGYGELKLISYQQIDCMFAFIFSHSIDSFISFKNFIYRNLYIKT